MNILRTLLPIVLLVHTIHGFAQSPRAFSYQAIARDQVTGHPLSGTATTAQFAVRQSFPLGSVIFTEQHSILTDDRGLFSVQVGNGTPVLGSFNAIDWNNGPYFLEVSLDLGGTGTFTSMGTQQLLSVPYALHAQTSSDVPHGTEVGQVAHWDGTGWVVDSGLYVHQRRLGIGVHQPDAPLGLRASTTGKLCISYLDEGDPKWVCEDRALAGGPDGWDLIDATANSGSGASRLFVQGGTGHIGLGTDDPPAALSIETREILKTYFQNGDIPTQDDFAFLQDSTGFGIGQGLPASSISRLFIQMSTGNVGVGTTTPEERFHVHGIHNGHSVGMRLSNGAVPTNNGWILGHLNDAVTPARNGAFTLVEAPGPGGGSGGSRFVILPGGNTGINEPNPTTTLHVTKPSSDPTEPVGFSENTGIAMFGPLEQHLILDSRSIQSRILMAGGTSMSGSSGKLDLQPLGGAIEVHGGDATGATRVMVTTSGNVGIGEVIPDTKLHVSRPLSEPASSLALLENTGIAVFGPMTDNVVIDHQGLQARHGAYTAGGPALSLTASELNLQRMGGDLLIHGDASIPDEEKVIITGDGRVGIGKSATEKLEINGAIVVGSSEGASPPDGTIRWNGTDFEGRKGGSWTSLTTHTNTDGLWQTSPTGGIEHSPPGGGSKVSVGLPSGSSTVRVDSWAAVVERSIGTSIHTSSTTSSTAPGDHRIGLQIDNTGTWGGHPASKNIGLYVSEVSGGAAANTNIAAVLNGNVVIGDVSGAQAVGTNGTNVLVLQNGSAPSSAIGPLDGGVQIYSENDPSGASALTFTNGNGDKVKLFKGTALTAVNSTQIAPGSLDPSVVDLINNMRTRINELESKLQAIGLLP